MTKQQVDSFSGELDRTTVSPTTATGKGKSCGWIFTGERYGLGAVTGGVVPPTPRYQGLTSIYEGRQDGVYGIFRPIDSINGYPAAIYSSSSSINESTCKLTVGLRNDTAYRITTGLGTQHPSYGQPCKAAKKLAGFVVQTLKEAQ